MAATLLVQADLTPLFDNLYDFVQAAWEIGRRARKLQTAPTDADAYTLFTTPVATREANIQAVEDMLQRITNLNLKVEDAISELQFAIKFLEDAARRHAPLPVAIGGPPFGVNTDFKP